MYNIDLLLLLFIIMIYIIILFFLFSYYTNQCVEKFARTEIYVYAQGERKSLSIFVKLIKGNQVCFVWRVTNNVITSLIIN